MIILLDAGHGETTPGKRSPDGKFREPFYCREILSEISNELRNKGYVVESVVKNNDDLPLSQRCRIVNSFCDKYGKDNVILISIHNNAAGGGNVWMKASGFEVWTSIGQTKSDELAECFYQEAKEILKGFKIRKDVSDGDCDKEANFMILRKTKCPAVLTENLFMDNKEDVEYLLSEKGKNNIVKLHVNSIIKYIELNK